MNNPDELFEKLMNDEISREEFEALLEGLDDQSVLKKYENYLQSRFDEELASYLEETDEVTGNTTQLPRLDLKKKEPSKRKGKSSGNRQYPIAASILILVGIVFSAIFIISQINTKNGNNQVVSASEPQLITKSTPNRRMFRMRLDDGSFVHLNAVSTISYPPQFDGSKREIEISGEAYFDIERDESRPFDITVKDYMVSVLGTSFNIEAYPDEEDFSVVVESGMVRVNLNRENLEPLILTKDQKLTFSPRSGKVTVYTVSSEEELSWRKGILRFDSTPMAKVEKMLERWYGVDLIIDDESIYEKTLSGVHQNENLKSVVEALTYATGTKYQIRDNSIIIKK
jgi:ferric-dicitrate binding protein FerR (iron transport regulator)